MARRARDRGKAPREIPRRKENRMNTPDRATKSGASAGVAPAAGASAGGESESMRGTRRWLVKTEPSAYSFADLVREGRTRWEGVENPLALIHLRSMRAGDVVLVYHTGSEKSVVGVAKVVKGPYEDPSAREATPKKPRKKAGASGDEGPRHAVVDLEPVAAATTPVSIGVMRLDPACQGLDLFKISRLSVLPIPAEAWASIAKKAGLPA